MSSSGFYTAAGNQGLFGGSSSWCGSGCGLCYKLTSTGSGPSGSAGGAAGQSIVVIVTDLCPTNGNEQWCSEPGHTNSYGYGYHFDIMSSTNVLGENSVVDFEPIACPSTASSVFSQCSCPQGAYSGGSTGSTEAAVEPEVKGETGSSKAEAGTTTTSKASGATGSTSSGGYKTSPDTKDGPSCHRRHRPNHGSH